MKQLSLVLFLIGAAMYFFACQESAPMVSTINQDENTQIKMPKIKNNFEGICTWVADIDPGTPSGKKLLKGRTAEWFDYSPSEPLVSGKSLWYINSLQQKDGKQKIWGKAEIFVGVEAGGDINMANGRWVLSWHGYMNQTENGIKIVCDANGKGKEGSVKGMVGYWKYSMDFDPSVPSTFKYLTEGYIQ